MFAMYVFGFGKSSKDTVVVRGKAKKTHPYLHKDGKNCYEKEITS
jgi:hypothetical protein